jgi:hypothetical protein
LVVAVCFSHSPDGQLTGRSERGLPRYVEAD